MQLSATIQIAADDSRHSARTPMVSAHQRSAGNVVPAEIPLEAGTGTRSTSADTVDVFAAESFCFTVAESPKYTAR